MKGTFEMELQTGSANGKHPRTLREQEEWQLTDEEIVDIERVNAEDAALNVAKSKVFAVRMQTLNLYKIEVEAGNPDEAHKKAIELFKADNDSAELLRTDYGHSTIEKLG